MMAISQAHGKIRFYEKLYGVTYKVFARLIQTDTEFFCRVQSINQLWEEDAIEWKFRSEELEESAQSQT